jgi:xanthine dehydrogenase molybdopterin binding subunit
MENLNSKNNIHHESAGFHVKGKAVFVNDMFDKNSMLIGHVVYSTHAHAIIENMDYHEALRIEGIECILSANDIKGKNQMGPVIHDEKCLVEDKTECIGQAILLIAAQNQAALDKALKLINIEYETLEPILTIDEAIFKNSKISPTRFINRGDISAGFNESDHILEGSLDIGGQEHWYLETQAALAVPQEDDGIIIYASSQNPTETQIIVAEVLGLESKNVICEVKRMGGGFGGKETQGNHVAVWTSLLAQKSKKPVMMQLTRDDDQKITGKRHPFKAFYKIGFDTNGLIKSYKVDLNSDAGHATDLSLAILERAMLHAENSYYIPNISISATAWKTNNFSNTAFRGFGGPQGMAVIEDAIDRIGRFLKIDTCEIRKLNFYGESHKDITPYGQKLSNNNLNRIFEELVTKSDYYKRKSEIDKFNNENVYLKKGIALTPVKFGISFTTSFLNQAGALVNIFKDGSVQINHGGTEMGQGLHTKILNIASIELGISYKKIKVLPTNTSRIPNTSATAASSGSDLNGMAVKNAIDKIKSRLIPVAVSHLKNITGIEYNNDDIVFSDNFIYSNKSPKEKIQFSELIKNVYLNQISLSATGFYKTPDIYFDRLTGKGSPFHYFSYGMAVSEIMIDVLTGSMILERVDIIQDVGNSINSEIDYGQITGGFVQGLGWIATEELKYDKAGNLLTFSPGTYKIPTATDIPVTFNISLLENSPNLGTIHLSKAIGEPPFMLAFSVWMAIKYAVSSVGDHRVDPELGIPAIYEKILMAIEKIKKK